VITLLAVLGLWLLQAGPCQPVTVGDDTGVFFLALSASCAPEAPEGFFAVAHLQRDADGAELLVLAAANSDQDTVQVAQVLAERVKDGSIEGSTWHDAETAAEPPDEDAGSSG
jgi:hypothetical protein